MSYVLLRSYIFLKKQYAIKRWIHWVYVYVFCELLKQRYETPLYFALLNIASCLLSQEHVHIFELVRTGPRIVQFFALVAFSVFTDYDMLPLSVSLL